MTDKTQPTAASGKYWARLCALPKFSFVLSAAGGVARAQDSCGNWVEASAVQQIVDDAESRITELEALQASEPAPAAVAVPESHTQALKAIAEWPVTDMLLNMDAANMRGIAQRALAAAPAQAVAVRLGSE